jgi:hypothetical protein
VNIRRRRRRRREEEEEEGKKKKKKKKKNCVVSTRKITELTPYKISPAGRRRLRWMDQVEGDLKRMKIVGWRAKVEDRQEWNRFVGQTEAHRGLYSQ